MILMPINSWTDYKNLVINTKKLSLQYSETSSKYDIFASEANIYVWSIALLKDGGLDVTDFENNYKSDANKPIIPEVITGFEKEDKELKLVSAEADVDVGTGEAIIEILSPGTFNGTDSTISNGRILSGGSAWFTDNLNGDRITKIQVVDKDNILGYGAGFVLGTYHDNEVSSDNQGWRMPKNEVKLTVEAMGGYGFVPSGMYLQIVGQKKTGFYVGKLYANIRWASRA